MQWHYISFAKPKTDGGFLGATVVWAKDPPDALKVATRKGLNPGGEAQIIPVSPDRAHIPEIAMCRNRLVGKEELMSHGGYAAGKYHDNSSVVCQDCNE